MRLVEIVRSVSVNLITAINLMALMQALPEEKLGYTPALRKGSKESLRVNQTAQRFGGMSHR